MTTMHTAQAIILNGKTIFLIIIIAFVLVMLIDILILPKFKGGKNSDTDNEIPVIKLGVKKEDLGQGTSEDRFRTYIIKYIEGEPLIKRKLLLSEDEDMCIQYIASIQHNLRLSFVFETGEPLLIDNVRRFCRSVYNKLKA